jgi:hypothetical protein
MNPPCYAAASDQSDSSDAVPKPARFIGGRSDARKFLPFDVPADGHEVLEMTSTA